MSAIASSAVPPWGEDAGLTVIKRGFDAGRGLTKAARCHIESTRRIGRGEG